MGYHLQTLRLCHCHSAVLGAMLMRSSTERLSRLCTALRFSVTDMLSGAVHCDKGAAGCDRWPSMQVKTAATAASMRLTICGAAAQAEHASMIPHGRGHQQLTVSQPNALPEEQGRNMCWHCSRHDSSKHWRSPQPTGIVSSKPCSPARPSINCQPACNASPPEQGR